MSAKNEQEKHKKLSVEVWCVFVDLPFRQKLK
jgi:peroxiredoxin